MGLQLAGVGNDGKLWHTIRDDNGSWQTFFGAVAGQVSGGPASFTAVACGSDDGQVLQVVGVGDDGKLWHTLRNANGSWQTFFGAVAGQVSGGPASFTRIGAAGAADFIPHDDVPYDDVPYDDVPYDDVPYDDVPYDDVPYDDVPYDDSGGG
jgi:hypothetical protein